MLPQNCGDLFPSGVEAMWRGRQILANQRMQLRQPIAGNGSIHVMFCVVMHVPVEKAEQRIQGDGATAEAKVRHIILQAGMLTVIAEVVQPSSIEGREGRDDRQHPPMHCDRHQNDGRMTGEQ